MPSSNSKLVAQLSTSDGPDDVIGTLFLSRFTAGEQPFAVTRYLQRVKGEATLMPPGSKPAFQSQEGRHAVLLARGDGWTLRATRWRDKSATVAVTATSEELARSVATDATRDACEAAAPEDDAVRVSFWRLGQHSARRTVRELTIDTWPVIARNYPSSSAGALDRLMQLTPDAIGGRILLHGPPGTGKTSALRALAHAWRRWCTMEAILDPEHFLANSAYLMEVALGRDDEDDDSDEADDSTGVGATVAADPAAAGAAPDGRDASRSDRFRLLVLEDCDELIRFDAKKDTGQALARLLNLTDGLLGQGLNVLVAISTNEPLASIHPAIARPGRCLAEIHVGPFPRSEAVAWLGRSAGISAQGATLAELYGLQRGRPRLEAVPETATTGQYL